MQTEYWKVDKENPDHTILAQASAILAGGGLVAFPTETVYGLGANGLDPYAVRDIYKAKGRPSDNPLILHIADFCEVEKLAAEITPCAKLLMEHFWPGPLTILFKRSKIVPDVITAGMDTVAIRMPVNKIARQLIRLAGVPIAAPSANISGRPSPTNAADVKADMMGKINAIVDGGACDIGVESTVVDCTSLPATVLRPGGITVEQLRKVLGEVALDPALYGAATAKPRAPGMKYRHYAPRAPLKVIEADTAQLVGIFKREIAQAKNKGQKVGALVANETAAQLPAGTVIEQYGSRSHPEQLAARLFTLLRRFDDQDVDVIFAEGIKENGIGLAVMNRMRKAAGFQIIKK